MELQLYVRALNALHGIKFHIDFLKRIDALPESRNVHELLYLAQRCMYLQFMYLSAESSEETEAL